MQIRVYVTVRCPIFPLQQRAAGLLLWARRIGISIDSCTAGAAAARGRSTARSWQCHVYT